MDGWKNGLPECYALYQEFETRFGPAFEVVERFLKILPNMAIMVGMKNHTGASNALELIEKSLNSATGSITYPALQ